MTYTSEDTIFVQIPCYRDSELQWTLKDLFEKAKRPENIFVLYNNFIKSYVNK